MVYVSHDKQLLAQAVCQNVKSLMPVEILNQLLLELYPKVVVSINSSPRFDKQME
jgi:hypothetical protein